MYLHSWLKFSKPKDDSLCHFQKFQMSKYSMMLVTLKTKSRSKLCLAIKGLVIMHLRHKNQVFTSNGYWFRDIRPSHWSYLENLTLVHKIQKWGCSDLNFDMHCSSHQYGTPKTSGVLPLLTDRRMDGQTPDYRLCDGLCWVTSRQSLKAFAES